MNKSFIVIWLLGFIFIFCTGLLFAHIVYTLAMKDFTYQPTVYSELKVKEVPKGTLQTDQYTPIQPTTDPQGLSVGAIVL
jgi:hypothetical protein